MFHKILAILIVVLIQLCCFVTGQCNFSSKNVENETRLVAIENREFGYLMIFNEDKVPVDTTLYFICNDHDVVAVKCNRNKRFNRTLPIQNCDKPLKAKVEPIDDNLCKAHTYRVAYEYRGENLEVYRSCYDKDSMRASITTHFASPYSIVTKRPAAPFTRDGIITVKDAASFRAKSIFQRFNALLGAGQQYLTSERHIVIDRGHLVPSADYVFESNMNATFKYINVIPQFSTINRGNWKTIENYIRNRIDETGSGRIYTGSFDVLKLKDQNNNQIPIYLEVNNKNPIPKWIFKILISEQELIVFLTYNNIFDTQRPVAACKEISCPFINLNDSNESGFTFCCDPYDFLKKIFPNTKY